MKSIQSYLTNLCWKIIYCLQNGYKRPYSEHSSPTQDKAKNKKNGDGNNTKASCFHDHTYVFDSIQEAVCL